MGACAIEYYTRIRPAASAPDQDLSIEDTFV